MTDTLDHIDHKPKRRHRAPHEMGQYVTDEELFEYLGVPDKIARVAVAALDKDPKTSGFPQKERLWGDRRYLPAVEEWLRRTHGLKLADPKGRNGL